MTVVSLSTPRSEKPLRGGVLKGPDVRTCVVCGCTEARACVSNGVPCHWVKPNLCSACAPKAREA